jgi:hypothetical protein
MHVQRDLFRPMCAEVHARQGTLFDNSGPAESAELCQTCGEHLTHTPTGYLCCPNGHGQLMLPEGPDGGEPFPGFFATRACENSGQ